MRYARPLFIGLLALAALLLSVSAGHGAHINPAVIATVPLGEGAAISVGVNPTTNRVYVGNHPGTVSVIDRASNAVIATVPVGFSPFGVGVNPATDRIYVANGFNDTVSG